MNAEAQVESYLSSVTAGLGLATVSEREKIAGEIAAHIREAAAEPGKSVDTALKQLGPPEKLAQKYRDRLEVARAGTSYSPVALLRASLRAGGLGVLVFLVALPGFWLGGALLTFGILTICWIALYVSAHSPGSMPSAIADVVKLIGTGLLVFAATTFLLRAAVRVLSRRQSPIH